MDSAGLDDLAGTWPNAERLLKDFEEAWRKGAPPRLEAFLSPLARSEPLRGPRQEFLKELIRLDLEYRWQNAAPRGGKPWLVEEYARRYPELPGAEPIWTQLIGEEYRARQLWGDRPGHGEYAARFAQRWPAVRGTLQHIDAEL